ncbi:Transcription factor MYB118 [Linum perenne]
MVLYRLLIHLVGVHGLKSWSVIAKVFGGRAGKQCRERWYNQLKHGIKKDAWSKEEDEILIQAHKEFGNKWAEICETTPWENRKHHQEPLERHQRSSVSFNPPQPQTNITPCYYKWRRHPEELYQCRHILQVL